MRPKTIKSSKLKVQSEDIEEQDAKESSVDSVDSVVSDLPATATATATEDVPDEVRTDTSHLRKLSLLDVTPALMSRITGYGESTCRKVMYDVYPNKEVTEFINQQTSIFIRRVKALLHNVNLFSAIDNAMVGKRIKDPEQMRLFVELQKLNEILNGGT